MHAPATPFSLLLCSARRGRLTSPSRWGSLTFAGEIRLPSHLSLNSHPPLATMASDDKHALPLTPPPSTDLPQVPFPPLPGKEAATVSPPASPLSDLITTHRRPLSDNEMSYFLPSRERGVNDMSVPSSSSLLSFPFSSCGQES